jgi:hypothetical protein
MVGIIRAHTPEAFIILASFFHLENPQVISDLNRDLDTLAKTHNLAFVDVANQIPPEPSMAYDYGHFTPEGDRRMGKLFAEAIAEYVTTLSSSQSVP